MKSAGLVVLFVAAVTASGSDVRRAVEPRDFFVYGCVREFAKAHAFPLYDSSTGYAVEYGRIDPEVMTRLYDAAKAFALTLPAPDLKDEDHGGVPVVARCLEESRSARVDALLRAKRKGEKMKRPYDAAGIDHILIGAATLDDGIRAFESATGVKALRGGRHPSGGTENALVSLGNGVYLEIIAPQPGAASDEFIDQLRALKAPATVGWAVHVVDAADATARLSQAGFQATAPRPGSRVTPQGTTLEWVTFGVETPPIASAPFFIRWGDATPHPSLTSPGGCSLTSFRVADPRGDELSRMLAAIGVAADVRTADGPRMQLTLRCAGREVTFD